MMHRALFRSILVFSLLFALHAAVPESFIAETMKVSLFSIPRAEAIPADGLPEPDAEIRAPGPTQSTVVTTKPPVIQKPVVPSWVSDRSTGASFFFTYATSDKTYSWTGGVVDGKMDGAGTLGIQSDGKAFSASEGVMRVGYMEGKWNEKFSNGTNAETTYEKSVRQGPWKVVYASGGTRECTLQQALCQGAGVETGTLDSGVIWRYEGLYVNHQRNGKGRLSWSSGEVYEGEFRNGYRTGKGVSTSTRQDGIGVRYEGDFVAGKIHGKGIMQWSNGHKYEGDWLDGLRTGMGTYTFPSENRYEGQFLNGKFQGSGTYYWKDGSKYIGDFREDLRSGRGIMVGKTKEGDAYRYEGDFENGIYHGKGTLQTGGNKYEGDFLNGKRTGYGVLTLADGRIARGRFEDGKYIGP